MKSLQRVILPLIITHCGIYAGSVYAQNNYPNIVFMMTDQQTAAAMSCAGNTDLKTPNMDRLATEGVRFTNAYCSFPLCTPSRASMFTGVMPHQLPVTVNSVAIPEEFVSQTLGHLLSKKGYECVYAGKWHLPKATIDPAHGFLKIHDFGDTGLAESCVAYLEKIHERPFFMVASFDNPHNICEYARRQPLPWAQIAEPPIEDCPNLPPNFRPAAYEPDQVRIEQAKSFLKYPVLNYSNDDWRRYRNAYCRLVEHVDREIGKVLDGLKRQGLEENTLVIFTSDHGDGAGAHQWNQKSALFEEVVNVPLIIRLPTKENGGKVLNQLVSNGPDLFASVCAWANINLPVYTTGRSLKDLVEGTQNDELHEFIVTETCFDASDTWGWMIRTPKFKYVLYPAGRYREQLFDMERDRGEQVNLAVESRYKGILEQHRKLLKEWAKENRQPFLLKVIPEN
jgi:arylsulfatase A-like enzyme